MHNLGVSIASDKDTVDRRSCSVHLHAERKKVRELRVEACHVLRARSERTFLDSQMHKMSCDSERTASDRMSSTCCAIGLALSTMHAAYA